MDVKTSLRLLHAQLGSLIDEYEPSQKYFDDYVERSKIISKTKEIQHLITDPQDMPMQLAAQMSEIAVLQVVSELDLFKHLPASGYISVQAFAESSGVQPALLIRMLRLLTAAGYITQNPENFDEFSHSYLSRGLINFKDWYAFMFAILMGQRHFHEFITSTNIPGYEPLSEPTDPRYCPATYGWQALGTPIWEAAYSIPGFIEMAQKAFTTQETANPIIGCYDFGALASADPTNDRLLLVDVGGGQGQSIAQIIETFPHLDPAKFMLQDLDGPVAYSTKSRIIPEATAKLVHDFFTPQPEQARGAKAYLLRRILHDWADDVCIKILKHLADAMSADSVLLVADNVIPERIKGADLPIAANDWIVVGITGKERTRKNFEKMFEAAGLELVQIHRQHPECGAGVIVEARLKQ